MLSHDKLNGFLAHINHHRGEAKWSNFFDAYDDLVVLDDNYNDAMHIEDNPQLIPLGNDVKDKILELEREKEVIQNTDIPQPEYDAVGDFVYWIKNEDYGHLDFD